MVVAVGPRRERWRWWGPAGPTVVPPFPHCHLPKREPHRSTPVPSAWIRCVRCAKGWGAGEGAATAHFHHRLRFHLRRISKKKWCPAECRVGSEAHGTRSHPHPPRTEKAGWGVEAGVPLFHRYVPSCLPWGSMASVWAWGGSVRVARLACWTARWRRRRRWEAKRRTADQQKSALANSRRTYGKVAWAARVQKCDTLLARKVCWRMGRGGTSRVRSPESLLLGWRPEGAMPLSPPVRDTRWDDWTCPRLCLPPWHALVRRMPTRRTVHRDRSSHRKS